MKSKSDFWLVLHNLTCELELEGATDRQRAESVITVLENAPREVINAYIANLELVAGAVNEALTLAKTK